MFIRVFEKVLEWEWEDVQLDVVEEGEVEVKVVLVVRVEVELVHVNNEVVPENDDDVEQLVVAAVHCRRCGGASGCAAGCGGG